MKTYNTYQEAKIDNPSMDILVSNVGKFHAVKGSLATHISNGWDLCNPADFCMTFEKFLRDGHKFVDGDFYLNLNGELRQCSRNFPPSLFNESDDGDFGRYVLRASALDKPEVVEWKNGDRCDYKNENDEWSYGGRYVCYDDYAKHHVFYATDMTLYHASSDQIRKPESPEEKEQRERLEAAYDLYTHVQSVRGQLSSTFDWFLKDQMKNQREKYLTIVDKTNYRKGE